MERIESKSVSAMDIAVKLPVANMDATIAARIEAILESHANNMIEQMDMGADVLAALLERARESISDEEFVRREEMLWQQRHQVIAATA